MQRQTVTLSTTKSKGIEYWQLRWYDPSTGKRRSQSIGRTDEVGKRAANRLRELKVAELEANPSKRRGDVAPTIGEWVETLIATKRSEGKRSSTLKHYEISGRYLKAYFGEEHRLDRINNQDARRFAAALRAGKLDHVRVAKNRMTVGPTTADKYLRICRSIFTAALAEYDEILSRNPLAVVKVKKVEPKRWHKVTPDEFWRLYEAANDGWKILLALCRLGGLRRSDALALKWSNVTLGGSMPVLDFVQIKTNRRCVVPIFPELAKILRSLPRALKLNSTDTEFVVPRPVYTGNVGRDFKVLCRSAKVVPYDDPLHTLRKSAIDDWSKSHRPNVVQSWAGHADIKTTLVYYSQVGESDLLKAVSKPMFGESDATLDATGTDGVTAQEVKSL